MKRILKTGLAGALISASLSTLMLASAPLQAEGFGPMNMMNPSRWFGGNSDDDDYYYGRNGGYPPPPPAGPYGAPGYAAPYAAPYGAPGYAAPQPAYPAPGAQSSAGTPPASSDEETTEARIRRLEERINQLESENTRMRNAGMGQPGMRPSGMGQPRMGQMDMGQPGMGQQPGQHAQSGSVSSAGSQGGYPQGMMDTSPQNHVWRPQ